MFAARFKRLSADLLDIHFVAKGISEHMATVLVLHFMWLTGMVSFVRRAEVNQLVQAARGRKHLHAHLHRFGLGRRQKGRNEHQRRGVCEGKPFVESAVTRADGYCFLPRRGGVVCHVGARMSSQGLTPMQFDFGDVMDLAFGIDVSRALVIAQRQGLGKMRHVEVHHQWVQGKSKNGEVIAFKADGEDNTADAFNRVLKVEEFERLIVRMNVEAGNDKASTAFEANNLANDSWIGIGDDLVRRHFGARGGTHAIAS